MIVVEGAPQMAQLPQRRSVLVVDSDRDFATALVQGLRRCLPGVEVLYCDNGLHALDIILDALPGVLMTDLRMPVMDGLQLLAELHARRAPVPIIALTSAGPRDAMEDALDGSAVHYWEKGGAVAELAHVVHRLLDDPPIMQDGLSLETLIELVALERKSCQVQLMGPDGRGRIVFDEGVPVHASAGPVRGEPALRALLGWRDATVDIHDLPVPAPRTISSLPRSPQDAPDGEAPPPPEAASAAHLPPSAASDASGTQEQKELLMANVDHTLERVLSINGAIGAALVDFESGFCLGKAGGGDRFNLDVAAAGNTEVVRAKLRVMRDLGLDDDIEDFLITLGQQYHLIRPLRSHRSLFLYLAIDREKGNLAMARHQLSAAEKGLEI